MAFPTFNSLLSFTPQQAAEIEAYVSMMIGYLGVQHADTGAHTDVTAESVAVTGDVDADGAGTFGGAVAADGDVEIGYTEVSGGDGVNPGIRMRTSAASSGSNTIREWDMYSSSSESLGAALAIKDRTGGFDAVRVRWNTTDDAYELVPDSETGTEKSITLGSALDASHKGYWDAVYGEQFFRPDYTAAQGEWTDVAFNAGNFTANGSMTWTVAEADQITFRYMKIGNTAFVDVYLDATTVGGTVNTTLQIAIPGGMTAAHSKEIPAYIVNNGTPEIGRAKVNASATTINVARVAGTNWTLSTNNCYVRVSIYFEVA